MARAQASPPTAGWSTQERAALRQPVRSSSQSPMSRRPGIVLADGLFLRHALPEPLEFDEDEAVFDARRERVEGARRRAGEALAVGAERRVVAGAVKPRAAR